jgi:transcriptional regulator with XRE-family HTH domain
MEHTSGTEPLAKRELYYYRQRQKNRVFADLCSFFAEEAAKGNVNKRKLAERLGCDPALITRWLSAPSNLTLDTISDILFALGAEMDHRIVPFADRSASNADHPLTIEPPGPDIASSG